MNLVLTLYPHERYLSPAAKSSMKLEGERTLPGTPEAVWTLLLDPDVLVSAIPGCEKLNRVEEDRYEGVINAKVGSIQSPYKTTFKIFDKHPPERYRLDVQGQGRGGFVKAEIQIQLTPTGDRTQMRYEGTANVGGRVAQVGQRMIHATATTMTEQGFDNLHDRIEREVAASSGAEAAPAPSQNGLWKRIRSVFKSLRTFLRALFRSPSSG